uniref:Interleukin 17a/f1 n=1 Tax=Mola mola TaxID=94237 RepID=A0A3Q3VUP0_MOLML
MHLRHSCSDLPTVCCSALWVVSSSTRVKPAPPPPACDSMLAFSSELPSSSEEHGNIHSQSLSPWRWRSSTVKNRIPSTLWEAECTSSSCSSPYPDLNSVPVYQNVLVLNRRDASRCFAASFQTVAVGCTCVRPVTNPASTGP